MVLSDSGAVYSLTAERYKPTVAAAVASSGAKLLSDIEVAAKRVYRASIQLVASNS